MLRGLRRIPSDPVDSLAAGMTATHGKWGYTEGCRCLVCSDAWNNYYRARTRAAARLIKAHRDEFERYWAEERLVNPNPKVAS